MDLDKGKRVDHHKALDLKENLKGVQKNIKTITANTTVADKSVALFHFSAIIIKVSSFFLRVPSVNPFHPNQ